MNSIVRKYFVLGMLCCAASAALLSAGCASGQRVAVPARASFAPGAEPSENASTGRLSRTFPHGQVTAVWIKSGIQSLDEASAAYCASAADDFMRRAQALDAELEESDGRNTDTEGEGRRVKETSEDGPRYTLSIKGGLSRAGGIIGRLWVAEEYLGGSRNNITLKTEMHSMDKGTSLGAKELFEKPEALPELLSRACRESLAARGGQEDMYLPGTAPAVENFRHFLVTENGLMLYFEPCQVASWAEGTVKVPVAIEALQAAAPRPFWTRRPAGAQSGEKGKQAVSQGH